MIDKNLILWLPFNDPDGNVAYDYTKFRHDATLSEGAAHSRDIDSGKALSLNGSGECQTAQTIPLSSDFTLVLSVKPNSDKFGWLFNLPGINKFLEHWIDVVPGAWTKFAFVKESSTFVVFQDKQLIYRGVLNDTPIGFSLNDEGVEGSMAQIDDVKLYNVAKSYAEVLKLWADSDVEYYLEGENFKDYGVYVSASSGVVGRLARKDSLTVDWDNYHGTVRDNKRVRYQSRKIVLDCFIEASSREAFLVWMNRFYELLDGDGTHRLKIEVSGTLPLVYEVVQLEESDPNKEWTKYDKDLMVGTFKLTLVEDEPVKKVLRHIGGANSQVSMTLTSNKLLNISWGDGTHTYSVAGTSRTIAHTYENEGEYDIIISGVIEDIEEFTTNAIVLWDKLK